MSMDSIDFHIIPCLINTWLNDITWCGDIDIK